jgi:2-hydroxychromene-2-carboxylate isomerase
LEVVGSLTPGDTNHLRSVLASLGRNPDTVLATADSPEIRDRFDAETRLARGMGIFGSPTFVVGDEIFWGDDRLEDALEWYGAHSAAHINQERTS